MTITLTREEAQQVLDALEYYSFGFEVESKLVETLRARLSAPEPEKKYDVVLDVLQKHRDKLWDMTNNNVEWGIMDQIRLRQIEELQDAMDIWVKYKPKDDDDSI